MSGRLDVASVRDLAPDSIADMDDVLFELRSLKRQVAALVRHQNESKVELQQPLPLKVVAPYTGYSAGHLLTLMGNPVKSAEMDLDILFYRLGRRWYSNAQRVQQWLDARAKRDPRLPAGTTLSELVARGRTR